MERGEEGCGCRWVVLAIIAIAALLIFLRSGLLEAVGLRKSAAQRLLSGTPDRVAQQTILAELREVGISLYGLQLFVLPMTGRDGSLAFFLLDESQGFMPEASFTNPRAFDALQNWLKGPTLNQFNVHRVAVEYRDRGGEHVATLTVPTADLQAYLSGRMGDDAFLKAVQGNASLSTLLLGMLR